MKSLLVLWISRLVACSGRRNTARCLVLSDEGESEFIGMLSFLFLGHRWPCAVPTQDRGKYEVVEGPPLEKMVCRVRLLLAKTAIIITAYDREELKRQYRVLIGKTEVRAPEVTGREVFG